MRISELLDRIASTRKQIIDYEKNSIHHLFSNSLLALSSGKKGIDPFQETKRLIHELGAFFKNSKIPRPFKLLVSFDLPSLDNVVTTINGIINMRLYPKGKTNSIKKLDHLEKERIKAKQEKKKELRKRKKRTEEEEKKAEEDRKKAKAADFEKLKNDLLRQIEREPYRNSPVFNFVEPSPGCHYDIGNSHGYVLVPIPTKKIRHDEERKVYIIGESAEERYLHIDELLGFIHETTYNITEQLFDNLGGRIDIQVITVTQWTTDEVNYYEEDGKVIDAKAVQVVDHINNTKFFETSARNNIFPACDFIVDSLKNQYEMHMRHSNIILIKGYVMKLQYRINRSHEKTERTKKYKGGSYINHFDVPPLQIK